MIVTQNIRSNEISPYATQIRVDAYSGSPLGNKFHNNPKLTRSGKIAHYKRWLWAEMQHEGPVLDELKRIAALDRKGIDVVLLCWCKPLPCHSDVVKAAVQWMVAENF